MKRELLGILLLLLFFAPLSHGFAVTKRPNLQVTAVAWGSSQAPIVVQPGDQSQTLIITVSNLGDNVAYHAEAMFRIDYPFSYPLAQPGQGNVIQVELGVMQILSSLPIRLILDIDPLAKNGIYRLDLRFTYSDKLEGGTLYDETTTVDVPVTGYTSLTVSKAFWGSSSLPIEVQPGDENQPLSAIIVNTGTAVAQNVTASLIIESPFSYRYSSGGDLVEAKNETVSVGTIMPGGSGLAQFILSVKADAVQGLYKLNVVLKYSRNPPIWTTIDIPVRGYNYLSLQKVSVLPPKVYPGDENIDLKIYVTNAGNAAAKNVSVEMVQSQYVSPSWGGADRYFIGTVQPGQTVPVDFYINIDDSAPSPSNLSLVAKIVYGPARNFEKFEEIPLFLNAKARFVVTSTKIPDIHVSDMGVVIFVTFKNNGTESAQGTRVELEVPNAFSGTTSDYLGTVNAGEEKTAKFVLDIDSNAKIGSYMLNQRISWSQPGATKLFTQDVGLELNIMENPLNKILPGVIAILIIAVVIAVASARRRSHGKEIRPRQE